MKARNQKHMLLSKPIDCDRYSEGVLPDLSACSKRHLQLPLKLNIVGKKLCEV